MPQWEVPFRVPKALGCSLTSTARTLLRASWTLRMIVHAAQHLTDLERVATAPPNNTIRETLNKPIGVSLSVPALKAVTLC